MMGMDMAVTAMLGVSAIGFLLADGERRRVAYVRALRRCLLRMHSAIRYTQPSLQALLSGINLCATPQERELTRLLHACAQRIADSATPQLLTLFHQQSARLPQYGVLAQEDRDAFETVVAELGRTGLREQLRLIDEADERLRARETLVAREAARRAQLIRALGLTGGAAMFLLLV